MKFKPEYMNRREAADYLGVSVSLLEQLASKGGGPEFYKINFRTARYHLSDLVAWLETRKAKKSSDLYD